MVFAWESEILKLFSVTALVIYNRKTYLLSHSLFCNQETCKNYDARIAKEKIIFSER